MIYLSGRMIIDSHCHLTFPDFEHRIESVLADAAAEGVGGAVTISTTTEDCLDALDLADAYDNVWCSAGVHPLYSDRGPHEWSRLLGVARHPKCVAWGELGLDQHYDTPDQATQLAVLEEQLAHLESWRDEVDLPVVIHCRKAFADLIPILDASALPNERFVFHCFTGGPADMRMLLDFGACVSFTGVVTYKNAAEVREAALLVPRDRFMVETDAPFLTPAPHRGVRPNEPKYVRTIATFLADLWGMDEAAFDARVNENTERFFGIRVGESAR
ncbi:MAG: TatD family hydrolase [Phycisphaerales bacterium]